MIFYLLLAVGAGLLIGALEGYIVHCVRKGRKTLFPMLVFDIGLLFVAAAFVMLIMNTTEDVIMPFRPVWHPPILIAITVILAIVVGIAVNHPLNGYNKNKRIF